MCVKSYCYLGDTGADLAAIARKWLDAVPRTLNLSTSITPPLDMKGRVYASGVRSNMVYVSEARPFRVDDGLERADMQMIRWMCGVFMHDRNTSEELRKLVGVEPITIVIKSGRLRWCGKLMRTV